MNGENAPKKAETQDSVCVYYKHQYVRIQALEDQSFKMSNLVFVLSVAVFAFASRRGDPGPLLDGSWLLTILLVSNIVAILYVYRASDSIFVHRTRAKEALETLSPQMVVIDKKFLQKYTWRVSARSCIQIALHGLLAVGAGFTLSAA